MTDKQIDINNQVEVGLNLAKELLELKEEFENITKEYLVAIPTYLIKDRLFYFYQRADWLNVCFNLLDKQLQAKEQECEKLKSDNLQEVGQLKFAIGTLTAENLHLKELLDMRIEALCDSCKAGSMLPIKCRIYEKALTEIKEIARVNSINTCWTAINLCADCDEIKECGLQSPFEKLKAIIQIISECEGNNE